jgi:hypothetical protein
MICIDQAFRFQHKEYTAFKPGYGSELWVESNGDLRRDVSVPSEVDFEHHRDRVASFEDDRTIQLPAEMQLGLR